MNKSFSHFFKIVSLLFVPGFAIAQTAEVTYTVAQAVPIFGSGIALLLGLALLLTGWVWLKKNPGSSYSKLATGIMALGMLASVSSGGWLVSNANAVIATTTYLFSENASPVIVSSFPATLENDLTAVATLQSIDVEGCQGIAKITGSCEVGMTLAEVGGSCSLDSVCGAQGQCDTGLDPITNSPWVICEQSINEAWISADDGGTYNADLICQNLGYDRAGDHGGTCGNVCGYCEGTTSCSSPGNKFFDGGGGEGDAGFGLVLSYTVHWLCVNDPG
jgi:hypothetical protein